MTSSPEDYSFMATGHNLIEDNQDDVSLEFAAMICAAVDKALEASEHYVEAAGRSNQILPKDLIMGLKYMYIKYKDITNDEIEKFKEILLEEDSDSDSDSDSELEMPLVEWTKSDNNHCQLCHDMNRFTDNWDRIPKTNKNFLLQSILESIEKITNEIQFIL